MKYNFMMVMALLLGCLHVTKVAAVDAAQVLPPGSYKESCSSCTYKNGVLRCTCTYWSPYDDVAGRISSLSGCNRYKNFRGKLACE